MRVLAFTNLYPSSREPTRGIFSFYRLRALAQYCDVRVVCPVPWGMRMRFPRQLFLGNTDVQGPVRVDYPTFVPIVRASPRLNPLLMYRMTRGVVERLHRQFPFDVVFASWGYPDAVAALRIARDYGCPQVTQLLGTDLNVLAKIAPFRTLISETLAASASVLTMSEAMAQAVSRLGVSRSHITVQHNGVDHDRFKLRDKRDTRLKLGLPLNVPIIVYVGNLVDVKGPDVLIEAFARVLRTTNLKPLLVLVGDGSLRASLGRSVDDANFGDHVRFVGRRPHGEIPEWTSAADLLCLPSRAEGCPNVVMEAFAAGRPVVASAVGAVPELMQPMRGRTVVPGNPGDLSAALAEALGSTWDAEGIRASVADLTWDAVGRRYFEVLSAALSNVNPT